MALVEFEQLDMHETSHEASHGYPNIHLSFTLNLGALKTETTPHVWV